MTPEQEPMIDPTSVDEQILELDAEDEPGFVQLGHWVLFNHHLSPVARVLYAELAAFVNRSRRRAGDTHVWPTLPMLAVSIGVGSGDQVTAYLDELVQVGAIVRRSTYDPKGRRTRNRYGVRFNPLRGHTNHLGVIMAHLKPIADDPKQVSAQAKSTKAVIKARREQAKVERAEGLTDPLSLAPAPYPLPVPDGNGKSAGGQVPQKTGGRTPKISGAYPRKLGSNNTQEPTTGSTEQQVEEGDARAREAEQSSSDGWGVNAGPGPAPSAPEPSGVARAMIGAVATRLGESLTPDQHRALAARYDSALAAVADLAASGADVHASHLAEYIDVGYHRADGSRTYDNLYAVLKHRLSEPEVRAKLPGIVARQAASEAPAAGGAWGVGAASTPPAPAASPNRCRVHGTRYILDPSGHGRSCPACGTDGESPTKPELPASASKVLDMLLPPAQESSPYGEHCGNERCHRETRVIICRDGDRVWAQPCPTCRPGESRQAS